MAGNVLLKTCLFLLVLPGCVFAQDDDNWPSLSYLRADYRSVQIVAHIRIEDAEITNRVGGYENWKINAVVIESFKGKFKKGDTFTYFHGVEAGIKRENFSGEKIVFLLAERGDDRKIHYTVLENSTLPVNADRIKKLRSIQKSFSRKRRA